MASDLTLTNIGIGGCDLDAIARAGGDSLVHRADEGGTAVGVDSVVTEVIGDVYTLQASALSEACSDGEHDAVAEGDDRRSHILLVIAPLGDLSAPLQEGAAEVLAHKAERDRQVLDAKALAVHAGVGDLLCVVL